VVAYWRQAALEGIGTCPISSSSNRSAIAEASLEEIIKSGEKVAKTSGMPPTGYTALEFHRLGILPMSIQTLLNTGWVYLGQLLGKPQATSHLVENLKSRARSVPIPYAVTVKPVAVHDPQLLTKHQESAA